MNTVSKILVGAGSLFIVAGLIWEFGSRFLNFGHMPGDIAIERPGFKFYFPIVTCLAISVLVSLISWLFRILQK